MHSLSTKTSVKVGFCSQRTRLNGRAPFSFFSSSGFRLTTPLGARRRRTPSMTGGTVPLPCCSPVRRMSHASSSSCRRLPCPPDRHHLPTGRVRKPRARSAVEWNSSPSEPCVSIARVGGAAHTSSTSPTIPPCLSFAHRREPTSPEPQRHRHELTAELDPQSIVPRFLAPLSSHTPQLSPRPLRSASPSPYAGNGAPLSPHCRRRPSPWSPHFPTSSESKINLGLPSRAP